jgi:hypothetical protein
VKRKEERIARAEARRRPFTPVKCHMLGRNEDQTDDEAIEAYGRHLIGPDDQIIMLVGVWPKHRQEDP